LLGLDRNLNLFDSAVPQKIFLAISDMLIGIRRITRNGCAGVR